MGVNVNTGLAERAIRLSDPDPRFTTDVVTNQIYTVNEDRLLAYTISTAEPKKLTAETQRLRENQIPLCVSAPLR